MIPVKHKTQNCFIRPDFTKPTKKRKSVSRSIEYTIKKGIVTAKTIKSGIKKAEFRFIAGKNQVCFIDYTVIKNKPIPKILLVSLSSTCSYLLTIFRQTVGSLSSTCLYLLTIFRQTVVL